jgi:hypothetical protein
MQIIDFINTLQIPTRTSCPNCGGLNTFSVNRINGVLVWHCFKANCGLKGRHEQGLRLDDLRNDTIDDGAIDVSAECIKLETKYKGMFFNPLQNADCYRFMQRYNLIEPYLQGRADVRYDPRQHRIVFILKWKGSIYGSIGRRLSYSLNSPKWLVYDRIKGCPFICKGIKEKCRSGNFLLTEDSISSVVSSSVVTSIAILGTIINETILPYLEDYRCVYIALDDDATGKSLKLQHFLSPYIETKILPIKTDIKYWSKEQLEELRKELYDG